eukprot:2444229-Rhodomonas_salina.4
MRCPVPTARMHLPRRLHVIPSLRTLSSLDLRRNDLGHVTSAICLRACYAMPGTDLAYTALAAYTIPGTDLAHLPTRALRNARY